MKKIVSMSAKKNIAIAILFLLCSNMFSQIVPLETARSFALLSGDSIVSSDTILIFGNAGATSSVSNKIAGGAIYTGTSTVSTALTDLYTAMSYCSSQSGTTISGLLGGQSLAAGVYKINSTATLDGMLTLTGDTNAVYIFNITDSLIVLTSSGVFRGDVRAENIFWNITKSAVIQKGVSLSGIVMAGQRTSIDNVNSGFATLLCLQDIVISRTIDMPGDNMFYSKNFLSTVSSLMLLPACSTSPPCNLICNPSFEQLVTPSTPSGAPSFCGNIIGLNGITLGYSASWSNPRSFSTPDLYNTCNTSGWAGIPNNYSGFQAAIGAPANGYAGIIPRAIGLSNYREYLKGNLITPLINGTCYYFEMQVNRSDKSSEAIAELGAAFSTISISTGGAAPLPLIPQVENTTGLITSCTAWTTISGTFQATGGEVFVYIGNFRNDASTTMIGSPACTSPTFPGVYYYIDNLSLGLFSVNAGPDVTINCTPTTLSATLTSCASAGLVYSWSPSTGIISGGTTANPVVLPSSTTTYTVTVSTIGGRCSVTDAVTITVNPLPIITVNSPTICSGATATLTAASTVVGTTYSWSTGAITNPITVTPSVTTSYTVTGTFTATGCTNTAVATVTVNSATVSVNSPTICFGQTATLTATVSPSGGTFLWSPTTGLACSTCSSTTANPTVTTTYTVTYTLGGCSNVATATVTVDPSSNCCDFAIGGIGLPITIPASGMTITGPAIYTNKNFIVNGNITINGNVTFSGCDMHMGVDVKIILQPSATLTINNTRIRGSHLYACGDMWSGIYVSDPSSTLIITGPTGILLHGGPPKVLIEDAMNAVLSENGGKYTITGTTFNKNLIGIGVRNFAAIFPGTVKGSDFTCNSFITKANNYTGSLYRGMASPSGVEVGYICNVNSTGRSWMGIAIENVGNNPYGNPYTALPSATTIGLTVGAAGLLNKNIFRNQNIGIQVAQSILYLNNCSFINCCDGVKAFDIVGLKYTGFGGVYAGVGSITNKNTFTNCNWGITATSVDAQIYNNDFNNITYNAIDIAYVKTYQPNVKKNSITKCYGAGIHVWNCFWFQSLSIDNNTINNSAISATGKGIQINNNHNDYVNILTDRIAITNNTTTNVNTGILGIGSDVLTVNNNTFNVAPASGGFAYGIRLQNCWQAEVVSNIARGALETDNKQFAIVLEDCPEANVNQNQAKTVGNAIYWKGIMNSSTLTCNSMAWARNGVVLDAIANPSAVVIGSPSAASDNIWTNNYPFTANTFCINSTGGANIYWYTRSGSGIYYPNINLFSITSTAIGSTGNLITTSPTNTICTAPCTSCTRMHLIPIAKDSVVYTFAPNENKWQNKNYALKKLRSDSSLMSGGSPDDIVLQQFYQTEMQSNIGKLRSVAEKIAAGNISDALTINNSISPQNVFEQNQQTVNYIFLNTLSQGANNFDISQTQLLTDIAMQEALDGGLAVYDARTLLGINKDIYIPEPNGHSMQALQSVCAGINLLGNASFEDTVSCPNTMTSLTNIARSKGWSDPNTFGSADYYNTCGNSTGDGINNARGSQSPRTGNAYAGIATFGWDGIYSASGVDYLQHKLLDTLQPGKKYCVSFYVSLADKCVYNCNNMGIYFAMDSVYRPTDTLLPFTPQVSNALSNSLADKNNWTLITGSFIATGGEKYLILGNFTNLANVDTSYVGGGGAFPSPVAYYYVDDILIVLDTTSTSVEVHDLQVSSSKYKLYPNPNNGKMMLDYNLNTNDKGEMVIYDITGKLITSYLLDNKNNQLIINNEQLNNGIYFYHINVNNKIVKSDKLVIIK